MTLLGAFGAETAHIHSEGLASVGTGTLTFDTTTKKSGTYAFKFDSAAGAAIHARYTGYTGALDRWYYLQFYLNITNLPTSTVRLLAIRDSGATPRLHLSLSSGGALSFTNSSFVAIGSSGGSLSTGTWYRIAVQWYWSSTGGSNDDADCYVDGVLTVDPGLHDLGTTTAPTNFSFGWTSNPGASKVGYIDDVVFCDNQGSYNNTLPGVRSVALSLPTADGTRNNWVAGAGGTTNLYDAINNLPPAGLDSASATNTSQIENSVSAANNAVTFTMQSYTTAGVGSSQTVFAIFPVIEGGNDSTTGADTLDIWIASNPNGSASPAVANIDVNDGTYPTGWNYTKGTFLEYPSVTLATSPTMTIEKNVATTRVNTVCFAGIMIVYGPASLSHPARRIKIYTRR